uniref:Uncharacterized protein n=1 Tax=Mus spicilegus TaxID=10103 RepID=A0A8C6HT43_MUSSI
APSLLARVPFLPSLFFSFLSPLPFLGPKLPLSISTLRASCHSDRHLHPSPLVHPPAAGLSKTLRFSLCPGAVFPLPGFLPPITRNAAPHPLPPRLSFPSPRSFRAVSPGVFRAARTQAAGSRRHCANGRPGPEARAPGSPKRAAARSRRSPPGFSVGQPEMAPQSEPRDGFSNAQEKMSSRGESTLHSCSGHETPGQKEGIHTEQAEASCMGSQASTPQKAEPAGSVPGDHMKFHCSLMRKHQMSPDACSSVSV